jgi:hypothetical protein
VQQEEGGGGEVFSQRRPRKRGSEAGGSLSGSEAARWLAWWLVPRHSQRASPAQPARLASSSSRNKKQGIHYTAAPGISRHARSSASQCMMMMMLPPLLLLSQAAVPPQPPPKCEGMHCRRSKCGDICTETDCSHFGNVCAGGASAPVGAGWTYESQFEAPDYPPDFTSENATIFYCEYILCCRHMPVCPYLPVAVSLAVPLADFNLLARGQFVPQLTLGDGLCNGTGPPRFDCAPCDPNPKTSKQWYMQAQYFWEGHDPGGTSSTLASPHLGRRGARRHHPSSGGGCHVIAGPLIPVHPGEVITTSFHIDKDRIWHASISNGAKSSAIEVPRPPAFFLFAPPLCSLAFFYFDFVGGRI